MGEVQIPHQVFVVYERDCATFYVSLLVEVGVTQPEFTNRNIYASTQTEFTANEGKRPSELVSWCCAQIQHRFSGETFRKKEPIKSKMLATKSQITRRFC